MQHVVNKALLGWVPANLISAHLAHAGNHRHGRAGVIQGMGRAPKSSGCEHVWKPEPEQGRVLVHSMKLKLYRSPETCLGTH